MRVYDNQKTFRTAAKSICSRDQGFTVFSISSQEVATTADPEQPTSFECTLGVHCAVPSVVPLYQEAE